MQCRKGYERIRRKEKDIVKMADLSLEDSCNTEYMARDLSKEERLGIERRPLCEMDKRRPID